MILVGDVGGTKTRLAIFKAEKPLHCLYEKSFSSQNYQGLGLIIKEFLNDHPFEGDVACFGVAGPVRANRIQATNLPWVIDAKELEKDLGLKKVYLVNDLQANAWGLRSLEEKEFALINEGEKHEGNAALVSAGTGLGEAGLYWDGKTHLPFACEGGHTDFGPRNDLEVELYSYLRNKYGHVSWERVVSGPGIYELYEFLVQTGKEKRTIEFPDKGKAPKIISEKGANESDSACVRALHWFISLYGAEAGNAALKFLSLGGVYIGGGIAPKIIEVIKKDALKGVNSFKKSFSNKGRMKELLEQMPIKIVLNEKTALLGAFEFAFMQEGY
ncbi:MAG: glucokinase [Chlamydiota bacterium]|jgi:glucokinase